MNNFVAPIQKIRLKRTIRTFGAHGIRCYLYPSRAKTHAGYIISLGNYFTEVKVATFGSWGLDVYGLLN